MSADQDLPSESSVSSMPLPPAETLLPQIKSEPWLEIDPGNIFLKGMAFDRDGNLFLMAAYPGAVDKSMAGRMDRSILKITPDKKVTPIFRRHGMRMCGHALHKDGRLFIACLTGELLVANPDGSDLHTINSRCDGKPERLNDLVFDDEGKLYVTDFTGYPGNATGGVYRWSADFQSVEAFMPNLVTPNGITFSAEENSFWVGCTLANQLFRLALSADRKSVHQASVLYHLSGAAGADGMCVDVLGNLYLAINFQGRVLVFNKYGIPIASVLMPGREDGMLLSTTNVAFKPGTNEVFVTASGETSGAWIFTFKGLAEGARLFSHR